MNHVLQHYPYLTMTAKLVVLINSIKVKVKVSLFVT